MKKIILKYGGMLAALAMVFTTLTVNSTCTWMTYSVILSISLDTFSTQNAK